MTEKRKTFAYLSKEFDKFWFDTDPHDKLVTFTSMKELNSNTEASMTTAARQKKGTTSGKPLKYPFSSDVSDLFQRFNSGPPKLYQRIPPGLGVPLMRGSPKAEMLRANLILEGIGLKGTRSMASLADKPEFIPSTLINQMPDSSDSGSETTEFVRSDLQSVPAIMNLNELSVQETSSPTTTPHPYTGYREDSIFFKTYNAVAARARAKAAPKIESAADRAFDLFSIHTGSKPKESLSNKLEPKKPVRKTREELDELYAASSYGSPSTSNVSVNSDTKGEEAGDGIPRELPVSRGLEKYREPKTLVKGKDVGLMNKLTAPKAGIRGRDSKTSSSEDTFSKIFLGHPIQKKPSAHPLRLQRSRSPRNYIHRPLFWNQQNPPSRFDEPPRPPTRTRKFKRRKPTRKEREEEQFEIFGAGQKSPDRVLFKLDQIVSRAAIRGAKERKRNRMVENVEASQKLESKGSRELEMLNKLSSKLNDPDKKNLSFEAPITQSESETKKLSPKPSTGFKLLAEKDITKTTAMAKVRFAVDKKNLDMLREQHINMIKRVSSYNRYRNDPAEREWEMKNYIARTQPLPPHIRKQAKPVKRSEPTTSKAQMESERSARIKQNLEGLKTFTRMSVQLSAKKKVEQWLQPLSAATYARVKPSADQDFVYNAKNRNIWPNSAIYRKRTIISTTPAPANTGLVSTRQGPRSYVQPPVRKLPYRIPLGSKI